MTVLATMLFLIQSRLESRITNGGDGGPSVPTRWGNDNSDSSGYQPTSGRWMRASVRLASREQVESVGAPSPMRRSVGAFFVEVFDDREAGSSGVLAIIDRIRTAFDRQTIQSGSVTIRFYSAAVPDLSGTYEGDQWRVTINCPFVADDFG